MHGALRKSIFALPFGCLAAIAAHFVRFGDEHAFGGGANETLVAVALGGSIAIATAILHAFLTAGTTLTTGTLASARIRALIPGAPALFGCAALIYYGIESLEGNGIEVGAPIVVLAACATALACLLRGVAALVARIVADIARDWLALLDRRERLVRHAALRPQPIHSQVALTARRFGRAPPNGRRFL